MSEPVKRTRTMITGDTRPAMPRHIKLRHDAGRNRWILLAPERLFDPDETAVSVLRLCTGDNTVSEIVDVLSKDYNASPEEIRGDVIAMLQDLADKGVLINSTSSSSATAGDPS